MLKQSSTRAKFPIARLSILNISAIAWSLINDWYWSMAISRVSSSEKLVRIEGEKGGTINNGTPSIRAKMLSKHDALGSDTLYIIPPLSKTG
eukprot:9884474-Heterocapsa_arctica.AAC.1